MKKNAEKKGKLQESTDNRYSEIIRKSLIKQLEDMGASAEHYISLIDDYVFYWLQERKMQRNIEDRGVVYKAISSIGKEYEKENPNVKAVVMYNKQKLAIIKELGLTTDKCVKEAEDEL